MPKHERTSHNRSSEPEVKYDNEGFAIKNESRETYYGREVAESDLGYSSVDEGKQKGHRRKRRSSRPRRGDVSHVESGYGSDQRSSGTDVRHEGDRKSRSKHRDASPHEYRDAKRPDSTYDSDGQRPVTDSRGIDIVDPREEEYQAKEARRRDERARKKDEKPEVDRQRMTEVEKEQKQRAADTDPPPRSRNPVREPPSRASTYDERAGPASRSSTNSSSSRTDSFGSKFLTGLKKSVLQPPTHPQRSNTDEYRRERCDGEPKFQRRATAPNSEPANDRNAERGRDTRRVPDPDEVDEAFRILVPLGVNESWTHEDLKKGSKDVYDAWNKTIPKIKFKQDNIDERDRVRRAFQVLMDEVGNSDASTSPARKARPTAGFDDSRHRDDARRAAHEQEQQRFHHEQQYQQDDFLRQHQAYVQAFNRADAGLTEKGVPVDVGIRYFPELFVGAVPGVPPAAGYAAPRRSQTPSSYEPTNAQGPGQSYRTTCAEPDPVHAQKAEQENAKKVASEEAENKAKIDGYWVLRATGVQERRLVQGDREEVEKVVLQVFS